jgi:hypothetical protein|uniref:Uncharacterized protein n=1 Tax=Myoviridae sp. ctshb19 TaxID=2825194 RepID=A0A8S5UGR0_9CAUD|nr:MAG TPA: hypothetical protein [Myoviridae sp. ctshb19]
MKGQEVTNEQRLRWRPLGYPMHFAGRHKCAFRLATLIERKIVVSTVGMWRPDPEEAPESLVGILPGDDPLLFETYVFLVTGFDRHGIPIIGKELFGRPVHTDSEAYQLHSEQCEKFQRRLNMGQYR